MQRILEASRALTSDKKIPCPKGLEYLPYQKAGVEFITDLGLDRILVADEPGVGKTIQLIGALNVERPEKVLIVVPSSIILNWKRELAKWLTYPIDVKAITSSKNLPSTKGREILITSYSLLIREEVYRYLKEWFCSKSWLGLDEIHYLKEAKTKRTRALYGRGSFVDTAWKVVGLTGTPIVNRPMELYTTISKMAPHSISYMSYFQYGIRYCGGFKGRWGWDFSRASNLKELGLALRQNFMIRRTKAQVLPQLPEKRRSLIYLNKLPRNKKLIESVKDFDWNEYTKNPEKVEFKDFSKVRCELGMDKVPQAATYIKEALESGHEKIVVFAHHKEVINGLMEKLKDFRPVKLVGGMNPEEKDSSVHLFQTDKGVRLFLGSITAAGVGLTLTAASYVIFVEPSFVPGENEQAEDRCHRMGQKNAVQADYLCFKDSLDERIINSYLKKTKNIVEVME